jgi:hypothetical protein
VACPNYLQKPWILRHAQNDEIRKFLTKHHTKPHLVLNLNSPATAPALLGFMGVFGKRLFEPSDFFGEFPIAAHEAE